MGQTPSKDKQINDLYGSYLKQQQDLIYQQQLQINDLVLNNIVVSNQGLPNQGLPNQGLPNQGLPNQGLPNQGLPNQGLPNLMFQQNNGMTNQSYIPNLPQITSNKPKLNPYKILEIDKNNLNKNKLKKAYLRAAMKYHPDRGGTEKDFQKITIAYTLLKQKLKDNDNSHSHNDLKHDFNETINVQNNIPKQNIQMTEKFDVDLFNKIYSENKIRDTYDDGYGEWMNNNNDSDNSNNNLLFQKGFNKDLFNSTFDKYKNEKTKKQVSDGTLIKYEEPETKISYSNQDSLMILGQDKINDFGGSTNNLDFTDYKAAFTTSSTLIDPSIININDRAQNINSITSQRSNISYNMTQDDQQKLSLRLLEEQNQEQSRVQRLQVYDQRHQNNYEKIHSLLLR